jgi:hypothetical protein
MMVEIFDACDAIDGNALSTLIRRTSPKEPGPKRTMDRHDFRGVLDTRGGKEQHRT